MEDDLLNKFLFSLKEHARAELTCEQYICNLKLFFKFLGRDPLTATLDDIRRYQGHLVDRKLAPRTINGNSDMPSIYSQSHPHLVLALQLQLVDQTNANAIYINTGVIV